MTEAGLRHETKGIEFFDVVIIGAGLAGLQCARLLAHEGTKVLLVDRKTDLTKGIHTTGIFVRKTFEDFEFPAKTLGNPIRQVVLYSPAMRKLRLVSESAEFCIGDMGHLYSSYLQECIDLGVKFSPGTRYIKSEQVDIGNAVTLERSGRETRIHSKVLIGADGARSRVAGDLGLSENREWIVGYEEVYEGVPLDGKPVLHCFLDAELAPGYIAWITNDGIESHIGVGGYPSRFDPKAALKRFRNKIAPGVVDLEEAKLRETRGGRIPVGGILPRISNQRGMLIGDAAGAVSPLTAGGLDPCMRLSKFAAEIVTERLNSDDPAVMYRHSGKMFRAKFTSRIIMRRILKSISFQPLLELPFMPIGARVSEKFAEKVFFGRSSFPDVDMASPQTISRTGEAISR